MTAPDLLTPPSVDLGLLAQTMLGELAADPSRFGLGFQLRPGTALYDTDPVTETAVVIDGDENPTYCMSLIGPMTVGARPMVMFVPPHGAYLIGLCADVEWRTLVLNGAGGWTNYGAGLQDAEYRRVGWHTELRGVVKRGATTATTIGTLDAGFWPESERFLPATSGAVGARVDVTAAGAVTAIGFTPSIAIPDLTLDGVHFGIAPQ